MAHEADLRSRLALAEREAAIADVDRLLQGVQGQVNAGHWAEASDQLHDGALTRLTAARLSFFSDSRLDELADAADRLQWKIDGRLTDESRLRRFRLLRHDVGFDATPFARVEARAGGLRQARAAAGRRQQACSTLCLTEAASWQLGIVLFHRRGKAGNRVRGAANCCWRLRMRRPAVTDGAAPTG